MKKNQLFYVFFSIILLVFSIPNEIYQLGCPFFAFFALVPFYIAYTNFSSHLQSQILTGLFVMLTHVGSSYWLAYFKDFAIFTLGASALGTGFIGCCVGSILYFPFGAARCNKSRLSLKSHPLFRPLWFTAVYITWEWIKSSGWFGYPWGTISSTMYKFGILTQIADITGQYGVSFVAILFSAIFAERILNHRLKSKSLLPLERTFLALLSACLIYGTFQYTRPIHPEKYLTAIMVQQNSDPWSSRNDSKTITLSQKLTQQKLDEAKKEEQKVDLVIWSEGCLNYSFPNGLVYYEFTPDENPLLPFIRKTGVPFLLGGSYVEQQEPHKVVNAALLFDKIGQLAGHYGKNHLVPCAEVLPFSDNPAVNQFWQNLLGMNAGWAPGSVYTIFSIPCTPTKGETELIKLNENGNYIEHKQTPYANFSAPICFDDAFPDVCRPLIRSGSELFLNITDDSWSKTRSSEYQHFVISSYRAIEGRTTLARSTNSGFSVVVDSRGRVLDKMPLFKEAAMLTRIPIYRPTSTIYQKLGNWLPHLCVLLVAIVIIASTVFVRLPHFHEK